MCSRWRICSLNRIFSAYIVCTMSYLRWIWWEWVLMDIEWVSLFRKDTHIECVLYRECVLYIECVLHSQHILHQLLKLIYREHILLYIENTFFYIANAFFAHCCWLICDSVKRDLLYAIVSKETCYCCWLICDSVKRDLLRTLRSSSFGMHSMWFRFRFSLILYREHILYHAL